MKCKYGQIHSGNGTIPCTQCSYDIKAAAPITTDTGSAEAFARRTDPQSSHEAAKSVDADGLYALILQTMRENGGCLSALMVSEITGVGIQTISPRFKQLRVKGLIVFCGKVINSTGKKVDGWRAV